MHTLRSILCGTQDVRGYIRVTDIRQGSMNLCDSIDSDRREGVAELAVRLFCGHRTLVSHFREERNQTGMGIERSEEERSEDRGNHQSHEMMIIFRELVSQ